MLPSPAARIGPAARPFSNCRRLWNAVSSVAALSGNSQPRLLRISMTPSPGSGALDVGGAMPAAKSRFRDPRSRLLRCFLLLGGDDLLGLAAGQLLHMVELMREAADAERQRAQLDDQVVQFVARQIGSDDVPARPVLLGVIAEDLPAPPGNQPLHARGEGVRHGDLNRVDRLQEDRLAFR